MKYGARPLVLLAVVTACSTGSQTAAERAAEAARADSSAAGYDVGLPGNALVSRRADSTANAHVSPAGPLTGATQGRGIVALPTPHDTAKPIMRVPDTSASTRTAGQGRTGASTGSGATNDNRGRRDSSGATLPPLDPAREPDFLTYDTTRKTVLFQLAAGDEIQDQVSFNGVQRGGRTLTVPHGWRVTIAFANRDPQLPHSATIVDVAGPVPELLPEPIFTRAHTVRTEEGLLEGDADELTFIADRVGRYLIACGVLGHAQRGQWLTLGVSTDATKPTYR